MKRLAVAFAFCFSLTVQAIAQSTATKDPAATAIAQRALSSMTAASGNIASSANLTASGNVTIYGDTKTLSFPVTIKAKGTKLLRYEILKPSTTDFYVLNQGHSCVTRGGKSMIGAANNSLSQGVDFVPALSILSEYFSSALNVQFAGTDTVNDSPADVITISFASDLGSQAPTKNSQHWFYIDKASGFVTKMRLLRYSEDTNADGLKTEITFSDFRNVGGFYVPFRRSTYTEGRHESELVLTDIKTDSTLSESDFALTCEVASAN